MYRVEKLLPIVLCFQMLGGVDGGMECGRGDWLHRELARIRSDRVSGRMSKECVATIDIPTGEIRLAGTVELGAEDSNLVIRGQGIDASIISGFKVLPHFTNGTEGVWRCEVPEGDSFDQLWVGGRRAIRARTPNTGFLYMLREVNEANDPITDERVDLSCRAFCADMPDIEPLQKMSKKELTNVVVRAYQSWDTLLAKIIAIDYTTGMVVMHPSGYRALFHWNAWRPRYMLENYRQALDSPGEWFLDGRTLLYIPRKGEELSSAIPEVPVCKCLLRIKGASNVRIENVGFRGTSFTFPGGLGVRQAANVVGAAVEVVNSKGVAFERIAVRDVSGYAVRLGRGVHNSSVMHSVFEDLGAGGVRVGSDKWSPKLPQSDVASGILVSNNVIRRCGRLFPEGVGVLVQFAADCKIADNDIEDLFYTGISSGWSWGYHATPNKRIRIVGNRIRRIGQGELTDLGGIYTLGLSRDSCVVGNVIEDVSGYRYAAWRACGMYADEGSEGWRFESNTVTRAETDGFFLHYGRGNVVTNNTFVECGPEFAGPGTSPPPCYGGRHRFCTGFEVKGAGNYNPFNGLFPLGAGTPLLKRGLRKVEGGARNGDWSLEFADGPKLAQTWMPSAQFSMSGEDRGIALLRFSFKAVSGSVSCVCQLRDVALDEKYAVGPTVSMTDKSFSVGENVFAQADTGMWYDFEMRRNDDGWVVSVYDSNGTFVSQHGMDVGKKFKKANRVVFYSPGTGASVYRIDDISAETRKDR